MVPEVSAADARRRRDDAVRRIREESARRIDRTGRVRAFSSWCALATLAGGISLAALDAREMRLREQQEAAAEARVSPDVPAVAPSPPGVRVEIGPVTLTPPHPAPAIDPPKHRRCYLWRDDDPFEPSSVRCVAWTPEERYRRLHHHTCAGFPLKGP